MFKKKCFFFFPHSRAICKYLVEKYGAETGAYSKNQLYPKDLQKRATVDQRMDFDLGALYRRVSDYFVSNHIYIFTSPRRGEKPP